MTRRQISAPFLTNTPYMYFTTTSYEYVLYVFQQSYEIGSSVV